MGEGVREAKHIFGLFSAFPILLLLFSLAAAQQYTATEISFIEWGDAAEQLKICEPFIEYDPADSQEVMSWPCGGPNHKFVDKNENFYFGLSYFHEFKAFRSDGSLLLDYSVESPTYNPEFYRESVAQFYVDSLCRIYLMGSKRYDYVAMVDTMGNLSAKLTPYGEGSGNRLVNFYLNSDNRLLFKIHHDGQTTLYTCKDQQFTPGGCRWWAIDGNCYWVRKIGSSTIEFKKYGDRDSLGEVGWQEIITRQSPIEMFNASFLGVDDDLRLYVQIVALNGPEERILVYDTAYEIESQIILPIPENRYEWHLIPFMRHDGNVYEFRCLDNGMHIYRWVRE